MPKEVSPAEQELRQLCEAQMGRIERLGRPYAITGIVGALQPGEEVELMFGARYLNKLSFIALTQTRLIQAHTVTTDIVMAYGGIAEVTEQGRAKLDIVNHEHFLIFKGVHRRDQLVAALTARIAAAQGDAVPEADEDGDPLTLLARLEQRHKAGKISEAQFEATKAELLTRM